VTVTAEPSAAASLLQRSLQQTRAHWCYKRQGGCYFVVDERRRHGALQA
jgi:hypothetical protein